MDREESDRVSDISALGQFGVGANSLITAPSAETGELKGRLRGGGVGRWRSFLRGGCERKGLLTFRMGSRRNPLAMATMLS